MGSNMQKQATPVLVPEAPLVATGIEEHAAHDTGRLVSAEEAGEVTYVDAQKIVVKNKNGKKKEYRSSTFSRTNGFTAFHQRPVVAVGDKVKKGDVLADTSSSDDGQIALGQNVRVAFMPWSGANYEDAIIISERLVKDSKFTSIHIEEFVVHRARHEARTRSRRPTTSRTSANCKLNNLDEDGVVRIGAEVRPGDILVGKITPKGETQLTPEERLLPPHLRRKGEGRERHVAAHGRRQARPHHRRQSILARDGRPARDPASSSASTSKSRSCATSRSATSSPDATATRASSRAFFRRKTCRTWRTATPSTSSSRRSAFRRA